MMFTVRAVKRRPRLLPARLLALGLALPLLLSGAPATHARFGAPIVAGQLAAPPKLETSGLASSRRSADVLWTHDDSGGAPALYAVRTTGESVGTLRIRGEKNEDWEDIASFELDGKPWLLIADTGDNGAKRATVFLHVVAEPAIDELKAAGELSAKPSRSLRVRYEDGPRDCEAVAVDPTERAIYLLTKREDVPRLYRVELEPKDGNAITIARHVAQVSRVPQPNAAQRKVKGYLGKRRGEVTAMDFASDGSGAVVLTYGTLLYYPRTQNEPWAEALARDPVELPTNDLLQVEAVCFGRDNRAIYLAAEGSRTLLRYDRQ